MPAGVKTPIALLAGKGARQNSSIANDDANPIPERHALIVPSVNPDAVVEDHTAQFGQPILLDLGGRGIRDMAFWDGQINF